MPSKKSVALALIAAMAVSMLSACGGSSAAAGSAPSGSPPSNPAPETIEGVATPSSVAVVTATNAN